jgi:hypothetical protein
MRSMAIIKLALMMAVVVYFSSGMALCDRADAAAKPAAVSCKTCHANFSSVIPKGHPPVKGNDLTACMSCHQPDYLGSTKKNSFATRMHLAHTPPKGKVDCLVCHKFSPEKHFGLIGKKESWGAIRREDFDLLKEIFSSWAGSEYMDNLHAMAGTTCGNCHGKDLLTLDTKVDNGRCLECHGPMEKLVQKTESKDTNRNPHKSHLDNLDCTICHKAHSASVVYCLTCHKNFSMKIPGAEGAAK